MHAVAASTPVPTPEWMAATRAGAAAACPGARAPGVELTAAPAKPLAEALVVPPRAPAAVRPRAGVVAARLRAQAVAPLRGPAAARPRAPAVAPRAPPRPLAGAVAAPAAAAARRRE